MKTKPRLRFARVLRGAGIALGILILLLYIGLPVGMAAVALWPSRSAPGSPPAGFEAVTLTTGDGVQLNAWYRPPENGAAIILLHGAGGTRESMRPYAEMLARHGYGVLSLDLRGHGESQGKVNRLGWQGSLDVGAAVAFLQSRPEVQRIGGLGSSMGGEVLLGAASAYPELQAIAADGATRRCLEEYLALEQNRPLVHNFTARVMFAAVQVLSGSAPPLPLLESMQQAPDARFLFVAAGENDEEIAFNRLFAETLGGRADLWIAPQVGHTGAFARYPDEYERRITGFFDSALAQ